MAITLIFLLHKIDSYISNINTFISAIPCLPIVSELNGTTCFVTDHSLIMILRLGISKNKSVQATFCIPVLQPIHSAITPFAPPPSPNPIES